MSAGQDPIREQLIEARRAQILDAATSVFADKGFHRATTKEIATRAGVSEGTIYNYFENKADLLIGIMTHLAKLEGLDQELADALHGDARHFIVAIFRHRMGLIKQNDEMIQAILPEMFVNAALRKRFFEQFVQPTTTLFERYVQARIEMEDIRSLNVPLAVRVVQGIFVGLLVLRILGDEQLRSEWDDMPEVMASIVFDGLGPGDGE
jgi:AcrR family transcriptional regulator